MSARAVWLESHVAPTQGALMAGDGCHSEEAKSLGDYLANKLTAQEAAAAIIAPVLQEADPPGELYRLNALLCEALAELTDDREKLLELLAAMQSLPPAHGIDWAQLQGFGNMWSDLYGLHIHGPDAWESSGEALSEDRAAELREHFAAVGTAEAELYVRVIGGVTAYWGYETLNLASSGRPGVPVFLAGIRAWLAVAGAKLRRELKPGEVMRWSRAVAGGRAGRKQAVEATAAEHWGVWRNALAQLGQDGSLSDEGRRLAAESHDLMGEIA